MTDARRDAILEANIQKAKDANYTLSRDGLDDAVAYHTDIIKYHKQQIKRLEKLYELAETREEAALASEEPEDETPAQGFIDEFAAALTARDALDTKIFQQLNWDSTKTPVEVIPYTPHHGERRTS